MFSEALPRPSVWTTDVHAGAYTSGTVHQFVSQMADVCIECASEQSSVRTPLLVFVTCFKVVSLACACGCLVCMQLPGVLHAPTAPQEDEATEEETGIIQYFTTLSNCSSSHRGCRKITERHGQRYRQPATSTPLLCACEGEPSPVDALSIAGQVSMCLAGAPKRHSVPSLVRPKQSIAVTLNRTQIWLALKSGQNGGIRP